MGVKRPAAKNAGSAVIEITMLIPVYIEVFFLYIKIFLFLIECGFMAQSMLECAYNSQTKSEILRERISVQTQGSIQTVCGFCDNGVFSINLECKTNEEKPADKIRRWQIAVDTVSKRGD